MRRAVPLLRDDAWTKLTPAIAGAAVFLVGLRVFPTLGVTPGLVVGLVLLPVWLPTLREFRGARSLLAAAATAVAAGLVLASLAPDRFQVLPTTMAFEATLMTGFALSVGVLLWARTLLRLHTVALLYGLGLLIAARFTSGFGSANPWKYALDVPVAIVLLALVGERRRWLGAVLLLCLAAFSATHDSRASMTVFLLSALLIGWQGLPWSWTRRKTWLGTTVLLVAIGAVVYLGLSELMLSGALGPEIKARSELQVEVGGSIIAGGRPEMFATMALMAYWPFGFGMGVTLDAAAVQVAKDGMAALNYHPDNGYVERYLFGDGVTLHSVIGDLWARSGLVGLALAAIVALIVVRGLAERLNHQAATPLHVCLATWTIWNLAFAPFYSAGLSLVLALALLPQRTVRPDSGAVCVPTTRSRFLYR